MRIKDLIEKLIAVETFYGNLRLGGNVDVEVYNNVVKIVSYNVKGGIKSDE